MTDFRERVPNIALLSRELDSDYSHIHAVLRGDQRPSLSLAKSIESATHGAITAVELLGLAQPIHSDPLDKKAS